VYKAAVDEGRGQQAALEAVVDWLVGATVEQSDFSGPPG
jgi:hypothetical protein